MQSTGRGFRELRVLIVAAGSLLSVSMGCGEAVDPDATPRPLIAQIVVAVGDAPLPRSGLSRSKGGDGSSWQFRNDYRFTTDWFTPAIPRWQEILGRFEGKPDLHYLEIGLFEGRSAFWVAENILTHSTSRLTGIDPFLDGTEPLFRENLAKYDHPERFTVIKGFSQQELTKLRPDSYDIIYIDGSHQAEDVLADAVMSWELLKEDGVIIFDDYAWNQRLPQELRPMVAIDAFITAYRNRLEVVHRGYQLVIRRLGPAACTFKCSSIGKHVYDWDKQQLLLTDSGRRVPLWGTQRRLLETLLRSRRFGADGTTFLPEDLAALRQDPDFETLLRRLDPDAFPGVGPGV